MLLPLLLHCWVGYSVIKVGETQPLGLWQRQEKVRT